MGVNQTKNTTILAMNIVGYSVKMNEDKRVTAEKLKNARKIIEKLVKEESGRIFNTAGDPFMLEFNSNINAVNTTTKIQKEVHLINSKFEFKDKLEFRVGVSLGDIIVDGTNLLDLVDSIAYHYLSNTSKANKYLNIIKPLYGEKPLKKSLESHLMWNNHLHYTEYFEDILKNKYWKN